MRNCCSRGGRRDSRRAFNPRRSGYAPNGSYRREGLVTGGFRWLACWLGLPTWVVVAFFVVLLVTVGWPALIIYLACALLLRPEPETGPTPQTIDVTGVRLDEEARDVRDRTRDLDTRIGRLEDHVTSHEFDFDRRLSETRKGRKPDDL